MSIKVVTFLPFFNNSAGLQAVIVAQKSPLVLKSYAKM